MRIGVHSFSTGATFKEQVQIAIDTEEAGLDACWYGQIFGHDALTLAALAGRETRRIELGTAVVPTFSRHPLHMAIQAVTTQAACDGRFSLGMGPSHKVVIESMMGVSYDEPGAHVREYLSVLGPLVRQGNVAFMGEKYRVAGALQVPDAKPCPVLISGLAPVMLRIAGELADGTITAWTSPRAVAEYYLPKITAAAESAGKPPPRVAALVALAVHDDANAAREQAAITFEMYGRLPAYQRVVEREGATRPADLAIVGTEDAVEQQLHDLAEAGVTDFIAWLYPVGPDAAASLARSWALLKAVIGKV
jgi:F420-dependent oxidoreductase-like protein